MKPTEAKKALKCILKKGDTIHCILRHVSRAGMLRRIDFYKISKNKPIYLTYYIAQLLGYKRKYSEEGLRVTGCGMDMSFSVVRALSTMLYKDGYALKQTWI